MGSKKNDLRQIRDPQAHKPKKHTSKGALRRIAKNQRRKRVRITPPISEIRVIRRQTIRGQKEARNA